MTNISFGGDQESLNALGKMARTDVYKGVVKRNGSNLQKMAQREAVFIKGYSTGATKRSVKLELETNDLGARVEATINYSDYLGVGTREMEAQPFIQPTFDEVRPKFIKDLRRAGTVK